MPPAVAAGASGGGGDAAAKGSGAREYLVKLGPLVGPRARIGPGGIPGNPEICSKFWERGFCPFGVECGYEHPIERSLPKRDMETMLEELILMGYKHAKGFFQCMICARTSPAKDAPRSKVGETASYAFCPVCENHYYYPHVQLMIQEILRRAGTDYMLYKRLVDAYGKRLPGIVTAPWYSEAHRFGTMLFAWTLTSPDDAVRSLEVVFKSLPQCRGLISVGSGSGYVETVFLQAARKLQRDLLILANDLTPLHPKRIPFEVVPSLKGVEAIDQFEGDMSQMCLLLCWPPFGSKEQEQSQMAFDALTRYGELGGQVFLYIGDVHSTGDWRFHELLASQWQPGPDNETLPIPDRWAPEKMGLVYAGNDRIGVYVRRAVPLPPQYYAWSVSPSPSYVTNPPGPSPPGPSPPVPSPAR
eukprot:Hpha_TRINITY_DN2610_c0_g1::TRINITY_DN2610_c0_g1_i1::g.145785::m.145785